MIIQCTKQRPWNGKRERGDKVCHHDTEQVGKQQDGYPGGDIVRIRCKNCGHTCWRALARAKFTGT